jgi:FkbM family methyltransferase
MSRIDRALGLARSLLVYHAIPLRQRRMKRLYGQFARAGDLVFDVGAHVGNRTRALASMGCRVIALEPQPDFAGVLRTLFARSGRVQVIEAAAAASDGEASLAISERNPTVSTLADDWRDARAHEPGFSGVEWNRRIAIRTVTLDTLIAEHGEPAFVKIDVEGGEPAALVGLTRPIATVSFEYLPGALDQVRACVERLAALAPAGRPYRYNWSAGETYRLARTAWIDGPSLLAALGTLPPDARSGDVYAVLTPR